ncbi:MAG: hypothetical protein LAP85_14915 [Acidobacteriia bacterium]|nr:hypothetical protein [Terriglobia bacterium]
MKRSIFVLIIACILCALPLMAQGQNQPTAAQTNTGGVWDVISDPSNIAPAAFLLSNVADAKTDWRFSLVGREYAITPAQRLGIAGGSIFVAYTIRHYFPRTVKPINIALAVATAYFAGRAYANTFNHGSPAAVVAPVSNGTPALAFSVQLRR